MNKEYNKCKIKLIHEFLIYIGNQTFQLSMVPQKAIKYSMI